MTVEDMLVVFPPEIAERGEDRGGAGLSETAERRIPEARRH